MSNLTPIRNVQPSDALDAVKHALRSKLDTLNDFLASVDWSGVDEGRPDVADLLGQLEGWLSQYGHGELTRSQYVSHLLGLLPEGERKHYYVMGGGVVSITVSPLPAPTAPLLDADRSPQQPQTGSDTPARPLVGEPESDIALAV